MVSVIYMLMPRFALADAAFVESNTAVSVLELYQKMMPGIPIDTRSRQFAESAYWRSIQNCEIVSFGATPSLPTPLAKRCELVVDKHPWPSTVTRVSLAMAAAEQDSCGSYVCAGTTAHPLTLAIVPSPFPKISGESVLVSGNSSHVLTLETGLVEIVPESVDAALLDSLQEQHLVRANIPGAGFTDWIAAWEKLGVALHKDAPRGGRLFWISKDNEREPEVRQYVSKVVGYEIRVYRFILDHELAHVLVGPECGSTLIDPEIVEAACDQQALVKMHGALSAEREPFLFLFDNAYFIVHWMVAMSYYDRFVTPTLLTGPDDYKARARASLWLDRADGAISFFSGQQATSVVRDAPARGDFVRLLTDLKRLVQRARFTPPEDVEVKGAGWGDYRSPP